MPGLIDRLTMKKSYANYYRRFERMSKQPVVKVSGLVSLTIIVIVFFMFFAILPTFKTIASLNREIEDTALLESKLQKKILSLQKAEEVYIATEKDLEIIAPVLPITQDFERLAWQVNWLAESKNILINAGNFGSFNLLGTKEAPDKYKELELEMTISGEFGNIKEYVKNLSEIDRLIEVKELVITKKKLKTETGLITANIKLSAYYLPEDLSMLKVNERLIEK